MMDEYYAEQLKQMVEHGGRPLTIEDFAVVTEPGSAPTYTPYGCVITEDGTVYVRTADG